ncbi:MAG: lipopolysaccharide biosynthesis protein [Candidatus Limnocylindrales bacterium]
MSDQWLPSEHGSERGVLQGRVARGLTWTLIDTWGTQILGLIVFVILANRLLPDDFGLVALAAVFVAFAQLLVDQGLGDALIQRQAVTRSQIDTAFWVAVVTGVLLTVVGFIFAGPIATALGEPRLEQILQTLSLTFVLAAFTSIQVALLRREMRFKSLAIRKLAAVGGGGIVGIAMAFWGYGAWALVGQQLASAAISVLMLWTVSPWRPGLQLSLDDFRSLFSFGIHVVGGDILSFLSRNVDNLLIGAYLGLTPLGFYAVGYRILDTSQQLLVNFARRLAFPIFARLQGDPNRLRRAYARLTGAISVVILPGYIGLALVAQEAIVVLFGERWAPSAPVAAILFLIGPVLTVQLVAGALMNGVGHPEITFRIRLVSTVVNVAGFFVALALFRDIVAMAGAFVVRGYIVMPLVLLWVRRYGHIPLRDQLSHVRSPLLATAVMAVAIIAVKFVLLGRVPSAALLVTELLVGAASFVSALILVDRALVREVSSVALQAVPGGRSVARRLGMQLPPASRRGSGRGRDRRRRESALDANISAEETATAGTSVAADSATIVATPKDEVLGDV